MRLRSKQNCVIPVGWKEGWTDLSFEQMTDTNIIVSANLLLKRSVTTDIRGM